MAKTYILEPAEYRYEVNDRNALEFNEPEFAPETDFTGSTIEVDGYPFKVIYAGSSDTNAHTFTEDGIMPESPMDWPPVWAQIIANDENTMIILKSESLPSDDGSSLTLSIYTGEDDPTPGGIPGLENKNVVYEYQLVANNNIKDILMAVMEQNGESAVNIPGYSVMELLVENLLVFHGITGETLTTFRATSFANDAEKVAWIIRKRRYTENFS